MKTSLLRSTLCLLTLASAPTLFAQEWAELGGLGTLGANADIQTIATDASGNVYTGGFFMNANNLNYVAKFNETAASWSQLGADINGTILSLSLNGPSNVYACGMFDEGAGGYAQVKRYQSNWAIAGDVCMGSGYCSDVEDICIDGAGNVYAIGLFQTDPAGDYYVAKWNGSSWSQLGNFHPNEWATDICCDPAGNVYVGGHFTNASGNTYIAKWNGTSWSELGGLNSLVLSDQPVDDMACDPLTGKVYVSGEWVNGSSNYCVNVFDGTSWSELGGANSLPGGDDGAVFAICFDSESNVYVAGNIENTLGANYVAKFDGSNWSETGTNQLAFLGPIYALASDSDDNIYAGGGFINMQGKQYVAKLSTDVTGLEDAQAINFTISPNPATEIITVNGISGDYSVISTDGKTVQSGTMDTNTIQVSELQKGSYILEIRSEGRVVTKRFVKA